MIERLEEVLKRALEESFTRLFPGTLHPLEIASALRDAARAGRLLTPAGTFVPNVYVVHLAPEDAENIEPISATVGTEMVGHLQSYAAAEQWHLGPYARVRFEPRDGQARGTVRIQAEFGPCPMTAYLSVEAGLAEGGRFPIGEVAEIGRGSSCEVVIKSPEVSRRHCAVKYTYVVYLVEDLGSANGTFLNAERVERAVLNDGDLLEIGLVQLRFHAE